MRIVRVSLKDVFCSLNPCAGTLDFKLDFIVSAGQFLAGKPSVEIHNTTGYLMSDALVEMRILTFQASDYLFRIS